MIDLNSIRARLGSIPLKCATTYPLRESLTKVLQEDVPALIAEIESLRAENAQLKIGVPCPPTCPHQKNHLEALWERESEIVKYQAELAEHRASIAAKGETVKMGEEGR
jgi:cell division protein FtsB